MLPWYDPMPQIDFPEPPAPSSLAEVTPLRMYTCRGVDPPPDILFEAPSKAVHRSRHPRFHPIYLHDYVAHFDSVQAFVHLVHASDESLTFQDAANDPLWVQAMMDEIESVS
jgi:hypothetical protein